MRRRIRVKNLIPPDRSRCQAEKPNGHNFMTLGGRPALVRCNAKPAFIAKEKAAGPDGLRGSMSLCTDCRAVMEQQMPDAADFFPLHFPEHDKLQAVAQERNGAQMLWDWLDEQGYRICRPRQEGERTEGQDFVQIYTPPATILAAVFGVDEKALEAEKRALLDALREGVTVL